MDIFSCAHVLTIKINSDNYLASEFGAKRQKFSQELFSLGPAVRAAEAAKITREHHPLSGERRAEDFLIPCNNKEKSVPLCAAVGKTK